MNLLIDLSNSNVKFALSDRQKLCKKFPPLPTKKLSIKKLEEKFSNNNYEQVILSSVVPKKTLLVKKFFSKKQKHVKHVNCNLNLGLELAYPKKEQIGADRLANAVFAAHNYKGKSVIIVDFGTTVTFDVISAKPAYLGGAICPGIDVMTAFLHKRTALLPKITLNERNFSPQMIHPIGNSTKKAIFSGIFYGYRGMILEIIKNIKNHLNNSEFFVAATGSYSQIITKNLPQIDEINLDITFEGLRILGELNP